MFLCDYHTHTRFSFDGRPTATHDALCRRALEVGLSDIAFTDHCDVNGEVERLYDFPFDPAASFAAMMEVKEKYKGRLNVVCGIELGNAAQYPEAARAVLEAHPYEFVIGSLHNLKGVPDFYHMNFGSMSDGLIRQLFDRSLDETLEMVCFEGITTLGHLTYMHRYVTQAGKRLDFKPYYDKITAIYKELIRRDIALEINVSSLWKGLGLPMPCMELLKLYKEQGGKLITIGSDAHDVENLGKAIRKGYAILETVGFHEVLTIRDGQRVLQSIQ